MYVWNKYLHILFGSLRGKENEWMNEW